LLSDPKQKERCDKFILLNFKRKSFFLVMLVGTWKINFKRRIYWPIWCIIKYL